MPSTVEKLKTQRDATKKIIQRYIEKLEQAKEEDRLVDFDTTLSKVQSKVSALESLNEKILSQTNDDSIENEMIEADDYSYNIDIKLRHFTLYRESHISNQETSQSQSLVHSVAQSSCNSEKQTSNPCVPVEPLPSFPSMSISSSASQFSRLPKLSLPKFDGDLLQWQSFWDTFESSIHCNINLSDVQKFSYLKAQLEGAAAMTVEGFSLTHANYIRAIELLRERYGQKHKIVHVTMQTLLNLPGPTSSINSLRTFYDKMETCIRGLDSLGQSQETYGSLLVPIVINKLPADIRKNLARENEQNNWTLPDLRSAINKEINILEAGSSNPRQDAHSPTALFYTGTKGKTNLHDNFLSNTTNKSTPRCGFCQRNGHHSNECRTFPDMDARMTVVKQKQLCFNCLGKHQLSRCTSRRTCRFCNKRHNTSICSKNTAFQTAPSTRPEAAILYANAGQDKPDVLLKTAVAEVESNCRILSANILFDEGAQRSFVTEKLATDLNLHRTGTDVIRVASFGNESHDIRYMDTAEIYLRADYGEKIKIQVLIVPTIAVPFQNKMQQHAASLPYLRNIKLAHPVTSDDTFEISLLIGADYYWQVVQDTIIRGNGPTAVKSKIGYLLSGPLFQSRDSTATNYIMNVLTMPPSADDIDRFWKLESLGISADEDSEKKNDEMRDFQQTHIAYKDGRYEARLPWKHDYAPLPTNYGVTKRRTESTIKRLSKDSRILKTYSDIIEEQEKRGFIERVPETDMQRQDRQIHYIPHHPVMKDSTTTPVRIVYDCSCRQSQDVPSLNDCLLSTPPSLNDLTTILVRFRQNKFAVSTDIEKAFLHVGLHESDRDVTRFFWLSNPADVNSPLQTYRFKSILFGATCSPFILDATLQKHLQQNSGEWVSSILQRDLYVDNVISSFSSESVLLSYFTDARNLMAKAGFNLRAWTSNSEALKELATKENVCGSKTVTKVLGMTWRTAEDALGFSQTVISALQNATKREILRQTSKIYDPLGFLTPVTVRAKILIQDIWKKKYDWDTPLPKDIQVEWQNLATDLNEAMKTSVDRYYFRDATFDGTDKSTLHVFVDASMKSYGAAAYLVNGLCSSLVMAKNRVAPLKTMTLPKLELMAAVVGARLACHLKSALDCERVIFWCDSQIVLHWLRQNGSKPVQRFVRNRVTEINTLTTGSKWNYCPTSQNPADLLTRGVTAHQHKENKLWWKAPTWITDDKQWPEWSMSCTPALIIEADDKLPTERECLSSDDKHSGIHNIIDICRYGSYKRLLRVTAYVLRFVRMCKKPEVGSKRCEQTLTVDEIQNAEHTWLQNCQHTSYAAEIDNIKNGTSRRLPLLKQLRLFLDNSGFLRCEGRIHNAPVSESTKFPVLLPAKHHLTRLIVLDAHHELLHSGISSTITLLRQRYWIPTVRQCVKTVIRKCVTCRKVTGKPYSAPDPPPLASYRVQDTSPFSVAGVDYTGALYVKNETGNECKVYICLFTCPSTRAVHLEVVPDLTGEAFIQAFRRFVSRKSLPYLMVSDNGTTFISAANHLKQLSETVKDELTNKGTRWEFIPKRAPWFGGFWERLIGLTKNVLKRVLGRAYVSLGMLQTIVTEVEAVLNDRPLTYVDSDLDSEEVLTPAHLLYGRRIKTLPYQHRTEYSQITYSADDIRKRAKLQQTTINHFRERFKKEYLTALREHHTISGQNNQAINVGDVVQVHDESPRSNWRLAVVQEVVKGNDGLVRSAKIRTSTGVTNRPIKKLYPLEVHSNKSCVNSEI